jgi:hypothetical protein
VTVVVVGCVTICVAVAVTFLVVVNVLKTPVVPRSTVTVHVGRGTAPAHCQRSGAHLGRWRTCGRDR